MYTLFQKMKDAFLKNMEVAKRLVVVVVGLGLFNFLSMAGVGAAEQLKQISLQDGERFGSSIAFIQGDLLVRVSRGGVNEVLVYPVLKGVVSDGSVGGIVVGEEPVSRSIDLKQVAYGLDNDSIESESFNLEKDTYLDETIDETNLINSEIFVENGETLEYLKGNKTLFVNIGDVNGDGSEDMAVGMPSQGKVLIYLLSDSYAVVDVIEIVGEVGFGYGVSLLEGYGEEENMYLAVSDQVKGLVRIIGLSSDASIDDISTIESSYLSFGGALDSFSRKGETYLAVSAPGDEVVVVFKSINGEFVETARVFLSTYEDDIQSESGFGVAVRFVDGLDEADTPSLLVGAPYYEIDGVEVGAVFIQKFKESMDGVIDLRLLSNDFYLKPFSEYGASIEAIGDIDMDGVVDIGIGAPGVGDGRGNSVGSVYVYSGRNIDLRAPEVMSMDYNLNKITLAFDEDVLEMGEKISSHSFLIKRYPYGLDDYIVSVVESLAVEGDLLEIETTDFFLMNDRVVIEYTNDDTSGLSDIEGNMVDGFRLEGRFDNDLLEEVVWVGGG